MTAWSLIFLAIGMLMSSLPRLGDQMPPIPQVPAPSFAPRLYVGDECGPEPSKLVPVPDPNIDGRLDLLTHQLSVLAESVGHIAGLERRINHPALYRDLGYTPVAEMRLREFYNRFCLPARQARKLKPRTLVDDRHALNFWEKNVSSCRKIWYRDNLDRLQWRPADDDVVLDPPIGWVVDADLVAMQERLEAGYSPSTLNKIWRQVSPHFRMAGPRDSHNKFGMNEIFQVPVWRSLDEPLEENWIPTADQVLAFAQAAAEHAEWPHGRRVTPGQWWISLLVFETNYGLRPSDWQCLDWNAFPDFEVLKYRANKTSRKRKHPTVFPLNATTLAVLKRLRTEHQSSVFWSANSPVFEYEWNRLADLAGLTERGEPDALGRTYRLFDRYSLRRFCAWWYANNHDSHPGEFVLNHQFSDENKVTSRHYGKIYEPPEHVKQAILNHPLPPGFDALIASVIGGK